MTRSGWLLALPLAALLVAASSGPPALAPAGAAPPPAAAPPAHPLRLAGEVPGPGSVAAERAGPASPALAASVDGDEDDEGIQEYVTDPLSENVARVYVSKQEFDVDSPWRKKNVELRQVVAPVVAGGRILVTASVLLDATFIEMSKFGDSQRHELVPLFIDQEVNLALLIPRDPKVAALFTPLPVGGLLPLRAGVDAIGWQGGQLTHAKGKIVDIGIRKAQTSSYDVAAYFIDGAAAASPPFPIVRRGSLVALAEGASDALTYAVPASLIRHFLDDAASPFYRGFATLGIEVTPLVSPDARRLYGAKQAPGGARIAEVLPYGPSASLLRPNDLLLRVAGHELDDYGRYRHPFLGRVSFKYLLNELHGGEKVAVTVLRGGTPLTFDLTLARCDSRQLLARPPHRQSGQQAYLIFGGLLFQELDRTFLESWGPAWRDTAPIELVHQVRRERYGADGAIVLSRVLADDFNQGYEDVGNQLVDAVNGRKVISLEDLRAALAEAPVKKQGKRYAVVDFAYDGGAVILGYEGLGPAHQRIAEKYGIDTPGVFFAPEAKTSPP